MKHWNDVHFAVGWNFTQNHELHSLWSSAILGKNATNIKNQFHDITSNADHNGTIASFTYSLDNRHQRYNDIVFCCIDILHLIYCDVLVNCDTLTYSKLKGRSEWGMYERSSCCHQRYLSLKHRQLMFFGQASQNDTLYQGAKVTKLPVEKPLKLVGCFSPWAKKK